MTFSTRRTLGVSGVGAALIVVVIMALGDGPGRTGATPVPAMVTGTATSSSGPPVLPQFDAVPGGTVR